LNIITPSIRLSLAVLGTALALYLMRDFIRHRNSLEPNSWWKTGIIGFVGNFFDTLGIGSFAIETALLKFMKQIEDRMLPGTLNVANALPTIAQALIFIQIIEVDPITLLSMIVASGAGAVLGSKIVVKFPESRIRMFMGVALLVAACFMIATNLKGMEGTGTAIGLEGTRFVIAVAVNFVLGALMTAGIGLYAPCMALVFALGMSPVVAFPIMMGSCAFLMPLASFRFIRQQAYAKRASIAVAVAGTAGVFIAAYIVKSMEMEILRWMVVAVIIYTAVVMLRAAVNG